MTVIFRCDSSSEIGSGHIMRCLNLAKEIRYRGKDSIFICKPNDGCLIDLIKKDFKVLELPNNPVQIFEININKECNSNIYKKWLGWNQIDDVNYTISCLKKIDNLSIDYVVIDHYSLDIKWEKYFLDELSIFLNIDKANLPKILVIDDLANRKHYCDLLLDQNYFSEKSLSRYTNLLPRKANLLLGPHYALLGKEYSFLSSLEITRKEIRRILIYCGAVENGLNNFIFDVIKDNLFKDIYFDFVVSSKSGDFNTLKLNSEKYQNINIYDVQKSLSSLMIRADLSIGAGGSTTWERCCLGLPALVITIAENQEEVSSILDSNNYLKIICNIKEISKKKVKSYLINTISKKFEFKNGKYLVDGYGTQRVVNNMFGITLPLHKTDSPCNFYYQLNEDSRRNLNRKLLQRSLTNKKFLEKIKNDNSFCKKVLIRNYILDNNNVSVGSYIFYSDQSNDLYLRLDLDNTIDKNIKNIFLYSIQKTFIELQKDIYSLNYSHITLCKSNFFLLEKFNYKFNSNLSINPKVKSITIVTDKNSWINKYIPQFVISLWARKLRVRWIHNIKDIKKGDICFILSFSKIINNEILSFHKNNLVVHESDLPKGKGWSPLTWQILEGKNKIKFSLIEANKKVDSGSIYDQDYLHLDGTELINEWRFMQYDLTVKLCLNWLDNFPNCLSKKIEQAGEETFYDRRYPSSSILDINDNFINQFNKFRVVDNEKYPAFFKLNNKTYRIKIEDINY